jgi:predicted nuclease with TOPRIM domain
MLVNAVKEIKQEKNEQVTALRKENQGLKQEMSQKDAEISSLSERLSNLEALVLKQSGNMSTVPKEAAGTVAEEYPVGSDVAQLWQNEPNPTEGTTIIRYYLPDAAQNAQIKFFTLTGQQIHKILITNRGEGQVSLPANELPTGTYVYHLLVDGRSIDSKKMVLTH